MKSQANYKCGCCGKPLTDPVSIDLGIGPVCRILLKTGEAMNPTGNLFNPRSAYDYTVENGVVCIVDHDNGKSVTNDAENVIADLVSSGVDLSSNLVIYRDTQGIWDQLETKGSEFAGFKSVNERDKEAAKAKVLSVSRKS